MAVKKIAFKGHRSVLELSRAEIRVLRRLKHVHIVRFIDYEFSPENATIIMEYCARGDLRSLIDEAISDRYVMNFSRRSASRSSQPRSDD